MNTKSSLSLPMLFLLLCLVLPVVPLQAQQPPIPPNVQKIMDNMQQGKIPTPEEQKILSDWAESTARTYGQGLNTTSESVAEDKKEELVLSVFMKVQSQAHYNYQGVERPPGIGTSDIRLQASDGLSLEYSGETRFRVNWGTKDGKAFPHLEKTGSHSFVTNKGSGMKDFKQTYHPKSAANPCTNSEKANWVRETSPEGQKAARGPSVDFEDKDNVVVTPFLGGCENDMKGDAFTRDECSHPNSPSEGHPKVYSIINPGTQCNEMLRGAEGNPEFVQKLRGKLDWNKPTLASGEATFTMNKTDWVEYPERYSPRKYAFPKSGNVSLKWSLTRDNPNPSEVTVDVASYESWLPTGNIQDPKEPGINPLNITVTVHKKGDKKTLRQAYLDISLPYVSKNRGICGNYPQNASEEEGLRFREKDFPKSGGLVYKDRTHLITDVPVEQATFRVHSYDYGAWGTMRITARDEAGRDVKVKVRGKDTPDLDIPLDDDANRIGDSWKPGDTKGKAKDWDDESIAGQDARGDGITLYDEYRGVVIINESGGQEFVRLNPKAKEMFLIDKENVFPIAKWEKVTGGFVTYYLNESLVEPKGDPADGAKVNYSDPEHEVHPVLARTVIVRRDNPSESQAPGFRDGHIFYIVPARIQYRIEEDFAWLDTAILKPESLEGRELREQGPAAQINYEDAHKAWAILVDAKARKSVADKLQTVILLHEAGHASNLDVDHGVDKEVNGKKEPDPVPKGQEELARSCLMFNQATWGRRRTLIFTALGAGDATLAYPYRNFCREVHAPGYQCFRSLKIKEW